MILEPSIECASKEQIEKLQAKRFRRMLPNLLRFDEYNKNLKKAGLINAHRLGDKELLKRIEKIPFTGSKEYMSIDEQALAEIGNDLFFIDSTSGSTGSPKTRHTTVREDLEDTSLTARAFAGFGIKKDDIVLSYDIGDFTMYGQHTKAMEKLGVRNSFFYSARRDFSNCIKDAMKCFDPNTLIIVPSIFMRSLDGFIDAMKTNNNLSKIIYWGEPLKQDFIDYVKKNHAVECFSLYGSCELGILAAECKEHDGLHLFVDHAIPRLKNPKKTKKSSFKNGKSLEGDIAYTNLLHEAKPTLAYLNGDYVEFTNDPCNCGRTLPRMKFKHRKKDIFDVFGTKLTYNQLHDFVYDGENISNFMQIQMDNRGKMTWMTIYLPKFMKKYDSKMIKGLREMGGIMYYRYHGIFDVDIKYKPSSYFTTRKIKKVVDNR